MAWSRERPQWSWPAKSPALAESGPEGNGSLETNLGLYALSEDRGTGTFGVGSDSRVNGRLIQVGPPFDE
jgi:hypothetical protein